MLAKLRKIGNSRGIIIPAPFLLACGIDTEVELRLEGNGMVIEPPRKPRHGWFDQIPFVSGSDPAEPELRDWDGLSVAEDDGEWEW